jgi:hypothetical protein
MKKGKYFIGFLVFTIIFILDPNIISKILKSKILSPVSDFVSAIIAFLNLIFIINFYFADKKGKEQDEIKAQTAYWYRNVILDRNIDNINQIFDYFLEIVRPNASSLNIEELSNVISSFQDKKRRLLLVLNDLIRVIDNNFAEKLDELLDNFEDNFTILCEDLFTCPSVEVSTKFNDLYNFIIDSKKKYIGMLYKYEKNGYRIET